RRQRRRNRLEEAVEGDAVADVDELAGSADAGARQGGGVLLALQQGQVGPGAAPTLEHPAEDVAGPAVAAEVQRAVNGVEGGCAGQPGCGQAEERGLRRVRLHEAEA